MTPDFLILGPTLLFCWIFLVGVLYCTWYVGSAHAVVWNAELGLAWARGGAQGTGCEGTTGAVNMETKFTLRMGHTKVLAGSVLCCRTNETTKVSSLRAREPREQWCWYLFSAFNPSISTTSTVITDQVNYGVFYLPSNCCIALVPITQIKLKKGIQNPMTSDIRTSRRYQSDLNT